MLRKIRRLIPQNLINYGKHLPEALLANLKYGFPSKEMTVVGVTGTDGKTTTANMIYQILRQAGKKVSMISSINAWIGERSFDTGFHVTSPSSMDLQKYIFLARSSGSDFLILEVTSHALDQFRTWGIKFDLGVITNVTHEHLDYHKTFEKYREAKVKLIKNARWAILNMDDPSYEYLSRKISGKIISYSLRKNSKFNLKNFPLKLKIPGDYNLSNALAAAATSSSLGVDQKIIKKALEHFRSLDGRMDKVPNKKGVNIVVDFAHTPNALEQALKTLRKETKGRLISVFGCASERDTLKRPIMGKISSELADITVLTDEDPRFEDRRKIIGQIAAGAYQIGAEDDISLFRQPDRQKAIKLAISLAQEGDTVGIFGKGHEKSMNYSGVEKPWSDLKAVKRALK